MKPVLRSIIAVVAGFAAASAVMTAVEWVNGHFLHPELGRLAQGMTDREAIRNLLAGVPVSSFLVVIFGWALGSLCGGLVAAWIGRRSRVRHALVLGGLLTIAGIVDNLMIPPPLWFWIAGLVVFIPAAYAGAQLAPQPAS
jgi:hypothetical protein